MSGQKPTSVGKIERVRRIDATIEEITTMRLSSKRWGFAVIACFEILLWMVFSTYHKIEAQSYLWAILPGVGSVIFAFFTVGVFQEFRFRFLMAYRGFYLRRYVHALDVLQSEKYDIGKILDRRALSWWHFYRAKDLKEFEKSLFDYLASFRRAEDLFRRQVKREALNDKLAKQLEVILDEFQITGEDRRKILIDFSFQNNPRRRRESLDAIRIRIVYRRWKELQPKKDVAVPSEHQTEQITEEDFRLRCLQAEASRVTSESALSHYELGLSSSSRHEKIRLFKRALSADIHAVETTSDELVVKTASLPKVKNEVRHLSLQDFARERLVGLHGLTGTANWQMCREIILALARPGQFGGRFNKHYFAEDTVKRMVRHQCDIYGDISFDPTVFAEAVSVMLKQGVLVTKPKVDERTLSLSTRVGLATPNGSEIISMVLRLKREMGGLPRSY